MQSITVNTEPEDRERSKMEAQSLWMENIICRYCIRIPAKIMYHRYIWMDIVCRDDEKKEPGDRSLFSCVRPAAHVSNGGKSRIRLVVGRI